MSDAEQSPSPIENSLEERSAGWMSGTVSFILHALMAMVISPAVVFAEFLTALIIFNNSRGINSVFSMGGVANPALWVPGLLLGLLLNRFALKSAACWVWLVGLAWIACGIFASLHAYHARFLGICSPLDNIKGGFFSFHSNYCGAGEHVFHFTVPMFNSVAYSLGAWAALWFGRSRMMDGKRK